jgi:hypothetical protein
MAAASLDGINATETCPTGVKFFNCKKRTQLPKRRLKPELPQSWTISEVSRKNDQWNSGNNPWMQCSFSAENQRLRLQR